MRRLLVKLVAIETALLGWLGYWLFLVYANNPSVTDQLSGQLQRFPQLSFTTVDIAVLVIIAVLSIILALKFHKGLRPGIRLERALQMLENLMKRNLVLEAQVAELKIEKAHVGTPPVPAPALATGSSEPRAGSWEKAFRTPLEAGPPATARTSGPSFPETPFENETGVPPPRIEAKAPPQPVISAKPPIIITEKGRNKATSASTILPERTFEKSSTTETSSSTGSSTWEDSPKYMGESKGILTPSPPPRRTPAISESGGLKQPYIPAPPPKAVPPSVIIGPMSSSPPPQARLPTRSLAPPQASPRSSVSNSIARLTSSPVRPPVPSPSESPSSFKRPPAEAKPSDASMSQPKPADKDGEKSSAKPPEAVKKKFPFEEE